MLKKKNNELNQRKKYKKFSLSLTKKINLKKTN